MIWFCVVLLLVGFSLVLLIGLCFVGIFGVLIDMFNYFWFVWMVFVILLLVVMLLVWQFVLVVMIIICIILLVVIVMDKCDILYVQGECDICIFSYNLWGFICVVGGLVYLVDVIELDVIVLQEVFNYFNLIFDQLESDYFYFSCC